MALTAAERHAIINDLATNSEVWKGDGQTLATFADDKLVAMKANEDRNRQAVVIANKACHGFVGPDGNALRVNPATGEWEKGVVQNAKKKPDADDSYADPAEEDDPSDEEDDAAEEAAKRRKKMASNRRGRSAVDDDPPAYSRPRTADEWFRNAPPEVQKTFQYAQAIETREKEVLINKLLVNVAEADRPVQRERLVRRTLDELHSDLSLIPKMPSADELLKKEQVANRVRREERSDDDMLVAPVMNWASAEQDERAAPARGEGGGGQRQVFVEDEDDWLRGASPKIREAVQNAMAIEQREKDKLIDELVGNIADEDEAKRMRGRFRNKPLSELKDLATIMPKQAPTRPNFFGAAGAPLANAAAASRGTPAGTNDDVLPLPKMDWKDVAKNGSK